MVFKKHKLSVTLVEAVVVVAIFSVIAVATGSILSTASRTGSRLADKAKVFQDLTWAMDYVINEARWGFNFDLSLANLTGQEVISFQSDINRNGPSPDDPCVWYWRGFNTTVPPASYGDNNTLYRGLDTACNANLSLSAQAANASRQELTTFVVDNPEDPENPGHPFRIFDYNDFNREFKVVLTTQTPNYGNQTLRARAVALNADLATNFDFSLGLVAHWPFDDGTADEIVNGIDGTFRRGATTVSTGKVRSLSLVRTSQQYVEIPNNSLLTIYSNITISAWVRYTGVYTGDFGYRFIYKKTRDCGPGLAVPTDSGLLEFHFNNAPGTGYNMIYVRSNYNYNDGYWHLVVATYDGSSACLYVDGDLEGQVPVSGNINYVHPDGNSYGTAIGMNGNEDDRWWDGSIDEVRVWERVLLADEVRALYLSERSYFQP